MRQSFWDKRLPTFLGLLFVGVSLVSLTVLTTSPQIFELGAARPVTFEEIRVSNQTATSLSVSFRTKEVVGVQLRFGLTLNGATTLFDDRDEVGREIGQYRTHHFTVRNLSPSQQYRFAMLSKSKTFGEENGGFVAKTASTPQSSGQDESSLEPVRGTVVNANGIGAKDALVFVAIDGAVLLSTIIKSQGEFLVPLSNLHTSDLTGFYNFAGNEILTIEIIGDEGKSTITVPLGKHTNLGHIVLGEHIDLRAEGGNGSETSGFGQEAPPVSSGGGEEQAILAPQNGAFLIDEKPLFRGKGVPSQKVEILIESEPTQAIVTVDANGDWAYQPDVPLTSGKHTVSAGFFDGDTITKVIRQEFEVLASGSQVAESATPSPTSMLTPTDTLSPSPSGAEPTAAPIPTTASIFPGLAVLGAGVLVAVVGLFAFHVPF